MKNSVEHRFYAKYHTGLWRHKDELDSKLAI